MDEAIDPLEYKIRFQQEHLRWGEYGETVYSPGGYYVVQASDWWLEYYFDKLINSIKYVFNYIVGNSSREQKNLLWGKKDDDYRPTVEKTENTSVFSRLGPKISDVFPWNFEDCKPYLNRRILKLKKSNGDPKQLRLEERAAFEANVLENFQLLKFKKFKDIAILVKNVAFFADSYILSAQSTWFRHRLFETSASMWDNFPVIEIPDANITPKDMEALLVYMYCHTWPTHVMLKTRNNGCGDCTGNSRSSPSKRFFEILSQFGVSLSLEKHGDDFKRQKGQGFGDPESILQETFLSELHPEQFDNNEGEFSSSGKASLEFEHSSHNQPLLIKSAPTVSSENSKWDFNPDAFVYNSNNSWDDKTSFKNLHPDVHAKKKAAENFLEESQTISEDYTFTGSKDSTREWVNTIK